ncbi:MAG: substrate-binding domain-containing protein [Verrucomicrobiota bacterium]
MKKTVIMVAGIVTSLILTLNSTSFSQVKLAGSVSLAKEIEAKKAAIETQAGCKMEIIPSQTGKGMLQMASGEANVAMIGGPVEAAVDAANSEKAGAVQSSELVTAIIKTTNLAFAVNPSAKVTKLSKDQIVGIFTGKIKNWKEVGGADLPIKPVIAKKNNGWRLTMEYGPLKGMSFASDALVREEPREIPQIVGQMPGGISYFASSMLNDKVVKVETELQVPFEMSLVTKGQPSGDAAKVISAVKDALK